MYQFLIGLSLLLEFSNFAASFEPMEQPLLAEKNTSIEGIRELKIYLSDICVICMDESSSHTVVPCGHYCLCDECSNELHHRYGCPICRAPIEAVYGSSDLAKYQSGELKPEPYEMSYEEDSFSVSVFEENLGGFWCCFDSFNACCDSLCSCFYLPFPED